jgi:hypothetical protein
LAGTPSGDQLAASAQLVVLVPPSQVFWADTIVVHAAMANATAVMRMVLFISCSHHGVWTGSR